MYEELYAPLPDKEAYLARIGLAGETVAPTVEWLDRLVHAQLTHVPFDDMDVWGRGDCPSLAIEDIYSKIVLRRRGGYCFELNSLFCALLRAVGYDAYLVVVTLLFGKGFTPPPAHCGIVCTINGAKYFCDVGFGGPVPDGAVRFDGSIDHGYRVGTDGTFTYLEWVETDNPGRVMLFHDIPALPVELIPLNFHVSQRPGSLFRTTLNLNLRLDNGSVSVTNRSFKLRRGQERVDREIANLDELRAILPEYFGIPADAPPYREFDAIV